MFLALLPLSLDPLGLSPAPLWRVAAASLFIFSVSYGLVGESQVVRRVRADAPEIYSFATRVFYFSTIGTVMGLQLLVLARPIEFGPGFYVLGLLGLLLVAAVQFVRILFIRPKG